MGRKRKRPSLNKQKELLCTVTGAWRSLLDQYRAADVDDLWTSPAAAIEAVKQGYEKLDDRLLEIEKGVDDGTLALTEIANRGAAMNFIIEQLTEAQQTMLRNARRDMNEGDFFF